MIVGRLSGVLILGLTGLFVSAQQAWIQRAGFSDPARLQAVGFSIGEKGYVATGTNELGTTVLGDLQEYDPLTDTWKFRTSLPAPLRASSAFTVGAKAYITTGATVNGLNNQLFVWDQASNSWTTRAPFPASQGRMAAVGISFGNRGYIATGFDLTEKALNDLWEYDPFSNIWTKKASVPGSGRCYATGFTINNKLYLGLGNNGSSYLQDWWEYTPYTDTWKRMSDMAGGARTGAMGFSAGGKGYVAGGVGLDFRPLNDVWEFDPEQNTWTRVESFPGEARGYGVGFTIGRKGYISSGISADGPLFELWQYAPSEVVQALPREDPFVNPVVISPNPFFYRFALKMRHPYTGMLEITIKDMVGRVVFRRSFNKDAYYIVNCWEVDNLPDGLFVFEIKDPGGLLNYRQTVIHKSLTP